MPEAFAWKNSITYFLLLRRGDHDGLHPRASIRPRFRIANPGSNPGDRIESLRPQELDQMKALVEQAIRKITSLPGQRERLRDRGLLKEGYFADVTISIQ